MPLPAAKVAFVTGVNGISGNAIVEHLIRQPKSEWPRIVITSRTPLKYHWQDPRVVFFPVDFLAPIEKTIGALEPFCSDVTHAYYTSYVHDDDFNRLKESNVPLFRNFLTAIDTVARNTLSRICLQTGGKHYAGIKLEQNSYCPYDEELTPRYDDGGLNFYYPQEDFMFELQKQRKWTYNIIRPKGIIGFTPGRNGMSEAITLALYFLICKETGEVPQFPGNEYTYNGVEDNSYAPSLADLSVWATTQKHTENEAFNHTNGDVYIWRHFFARLGGYFGLEVPETKFTPKDKNNQETETVEHNFLMTDWANQNNKRQIWHKICQKYGGNPDAFNWGTWQFFNWGVAKASPAISSVSKARKFGWLRYDDTYETWVETFRAFENAGILPRRERVVQGVV